jgi:hypothetical protein
VAPAVADNGALAVAAAEPLPLPRGDGDAVGEALPVRSGGTEALTVGVPLGEPVAEAQALSLGERAPLRVPVGELDGEREAEGEPEGEGAALQLPVALGEGGAEREGACVGVGRAEAEALPVAEPLAPPLRLAADEALVEALPLSLEVGCPLRLPAGVRLLESPPLREAVADAHAESVRVAAPVDDCEGELLPLPPPAVDVRDGATEALHVGVWVTVAQGEPLRGTLSVRGGVAVAEEKPLEEGEPTELRLGEEEALRVD